MTEFDAPQLMRDESYVQADIARLAELLKEVIGKYMSFEGISVLERRTIIKAALARCQPGLE